MLIPASPGVVHRRSELLLGITRSDHRSGRHLWMNDFTIGTPKRVGDAVAANAKYVESRRS